MDRVERVAKAICEASGPQAWDALTSWATISPSELKPGTLGYRAPPSAFREAREDRAKWLRIAQAAIDAADMKND